MNFYRKSIFILFLLVLVSCSQIGLSSSDPDPVPTNANGVIEKKATFTPTGTPILGVTLAPTPTATPTLHPLSIDYLRNMDFPGSEPVFEETLEPYGFYERYLVSYRSEGLKIYAYMTIPRGETPPTGWPVIVFNHGYIPPDEYISTERYIAYVDRIASSGYIVFRPDYRGHGNSEGESGGAYSRPAYTIDVLNALASVQKLPAADENRVGMWGHSMGGYITLRSMVVNPDIRAGVIWAGVVGSYEDIVYNWHRGRDPITQTPTWVRRWRGRLVDEFGTPAENQDFWNSISANAYLNDLSGPVQLHHGTADESVPVFFSEKLAEQIEEAGMNVELFTYPGDNHNIGNYFEPAMARSVDFFDQYVKNAQLE